MINWFQDKMTFFPAKDITLTPKDFDVPFEDVFLKTQDQQTIHGWFLKTSDQAPTLLFFHGNAGNLSNRSENVALLQKEVGVNILIIDYRGYGKSSGKPSEKGMYIDAETAYQELTQNRGIDPKKIIIFGRSLGAGVAGFLASQVKQGKVILEAPFTNTRDMAYEVTPFFLIPRIMENRFDNKTYMKNLMIPKMVIHGNQDAVVPFYMGKELFELMTHPKRFYIIDGADHHDTYIVGGKTYWENLKNFIIEN